MADQIIAIDGPAGSGKSSVSKAVAKQLGFEYLDTGATYRALGLWLLDSKINTCEEAIVLAALAGFRYEISTDPKNYWVRVSGEDVTRRIREPRASVAASGALAQLPKVRSFLVELHRKIISDSNAVGIVVEGRDITTVVAPEAKLRIFMTAAEQVRLSRRAAEQTGAKLSEEVSKRDIRDAKRLDAASADPGIAVLDTTLLSFDESVAAVIALWNLA